jgi:hypothetical protein
MKRLFRKIAEFFGFVAKQPKPNQKVETDWNEVDEKYFSKESPLSFNSMPNTEEPIDDGVPTQDIADAEIGKVVLTSKEEIKPKPSLPKDANDIQLLDKKYNNPNTVYRNNKGRFASLQK